MTHSTTKPNGMNFSQYASDLPVPAVILRENVQHLTIESKSVEILLLSLI